MFRIRSLALATAGVALLGLTAVQPAAAAAGDLDRPSDPVVLTGDDLPRVPGLAPDDVVAFSYVDGAWRQVPVQVDERHVVNLYEMLQPYINVAGPEPLLDTLLYSDPKTLVGADPNPDIDLDDEIVLMAHDAGGQAPAGSEPSGVEAGSGHAVTVADPTDGGQAGFVYLFVQDGSLDPAAGKDYVNYDFRLLDGGTSPTDYNFETPPGDYSAIGDPPENPTPGLNPEDSTVQTSAYSTAFKDRWINDELRIAAGGASGADILDRDQHNLIFGGDPNHGICGRTENTFAAGKGALFTNTDGPVRAIREYMGSNSGRYTSKRHVFYERRQDMSVFLRLHPAYGPDWVQDYSTEAIGMTYRNNLNLGGVTIDGEPDDVNINGLLAWEQLTGAQGTYTSIWSSEVGVADPPGQTAPPPSADPTPFYLDDETVESAADLPEVVWPVQCTGDSKAIGTSGQATYGAVKNTDPTRPNRPLYSIVAQRFQYYDGPNQTVADAQQRDAWIRQPLTVAVSPFGEVGPTERYVIAAYHDFLDRAPDPGGQAYWSGRLDQGLSRYQFVVQLATSPEYVATVVTGFYQDTLGRPPDAAGRSYWVGEIRSGRRTVAEVAASFYASDEYFTGIGDGTLNSWITDLYRQLLGREPDAAGRSYWVNRARAEGRGPVALAFYQSNESARSRVAALYQDLLQRNPEPGGHTYWAGRIVSEGDLVLAAQLAASPEYFQNAQTRTFS